MRKITTLLAFLLLAVSQGAFAQKTITGKVISSEDGLGMIGVPVVVKGTTIGTATDIDGNFSLNVPNDAATIVVSFIGYKTVEMPVGNQTRLIITMESDVIALGDVVVTALGIQREAKTLTYSAQQVSGAEIMKAQDMNFMGALQGRAAGLEIKRAASGAGGSTRTVLRGSKSFSGSSAPLYVVDGVPLRSTGGASGAMWGGYDEGDAISQINPEDIENISVLKGANAAMLYGSAGANGVIMITTKKGSEGTMNINISNTTTFESLLMLPELQYKYGAVGAAKESWDTTPLSSYDDKFVKDFFQTGHNVVSNVSISGGTRATTVYFSYGNTISKGIVPENTYRRDNVTLRQSTKLFNDKVSIGTSVMLTNDMARNRTPSGYYLNPLTGLYFFPRQKDISHFNGDNYQIWLQERQLYTMNWFVNDHHQSNPWWIMNKQPRWNGGKRLNGSVNIDWNIAKPLILSVKGSYDYDNRISEQQHYAGSNTTNVSRNGTWNFSQGIGFATYVEALLKYNEKFGDFSLNAIVGTSYRESGSKAGISVSTGSSNDLIFPNVFTLQNVPAAVWPSTTGNSTTIKGGLFSNLMLGFKEKLFLDLSGRNDWSSTLAGTDNGISYFYPAIGFSAIVSQIVSLPDFITFGKVRASHTTVANDMGFDNIFQRATIQSSSGSASTPSRPDWTDARPEMIASFELGTDWRFLEGKVGFDFTYYDITSTDQRVEVPTLQGVGFNNRYMNLGKIVNRGVELMIDAEPVATSDLSWKTSLSFTHNKNTIVEVNPEDPNQRISLGNSEGYYSWIAKGGSFGDLYTYRFTYDDQGRLRLDNNYKPLRSKDPEKVGRSTPDFQLGWNNSFNYKRWSMGFLISGVFGGKVMSQTESMLDGYGVSKRTADARDKGYVEVNAIVDVPAVLDAEGNVTTPAGSHHGEVVTRVDPETWFKAIGDRNGIGEAYIYDRTNIRFTQFSLTYNVPVRALNLPLKSASVGLVGQNLFFFYNAAPYDPELTMNTGRDSQALDNFSLPATRTYGFNIKLNF